MSKERQIRKISLNVSGLKGLILEGTYESYKDNKLVINGFKDTLKSPIHFELEDKIKELRFFALEICGLITDTTTKHEKSTLLEQADIISIEFKKGIDGFFKLKASSRVFDTKSQNLTTPKVDVSDNYEYYYTVMNIIEAILAEVDQYAKGLKKVTDEEIMMSYVRHGKDKNVDISALNEMSAEERADYCQSVLEKLGCLVIRPDEVEDGEIEEELVTETEQPLMLEMDPMSDEAQAMWKATGPEEDSDTIPEGEESGPMPSSELISKLKASEPIKLPK